MSLLPLFAKRPSVSLRRTPVSGKVVAGPRGSYLDTALKKCTNVDIAGPQWAEQDKGFFDSCARIIAQVCKKHTEIALEPLEDKGYMLQRYREGEYFKQHIDAYSSDTMMRLIAIIWYLNDVPEGGETFFHFQDLKINPKAGSAIAFPPYWTHRHEGLPPLSGTKYIGTTFVYRKLR
jgi:hypothetical protein